jgi:serine/threonine-protein kinase
LHGGNTLLPLQTVALATGLLRGLSEAHERSIIHRDIKPSNVLLGHNGSIKLSDFGIAGLKSQNLTGMSGVIGTPGYIAPEVITGSEYGEVSDIFGVGVVLYRCLVGYPPFRGPSVKDILKATRDQAPTPPHEINPEIPESLSTLVMSLLIKDPLKRPNNAAVVADTLERTLGVQKWVPRFFYDAPQAQDTIGTGTSILPDTLTQKILRVN